MTSLFDRCLRKFAIAAAGTFARLKFNTHRIITDEPPQGALILCNHTMLWDFSNLLWAMFPRSDQHFLATNVVYDKNRFISWLFRHLGIIRKNQGVADLGSLKNMIKTSREGGTLVIYAAGMLSFDGREAVRYLPGTGSLPRILKTDVYAAVTHGGFLTSPRYSHKMARGRLDIELKRLYTAEEASKLSAEEMQKGIEDALSFNDWDWQEKNRVPFKRIRNVSRLSRVLYMCPACRREGVMLEEKHALRCDSCGLVATRDRYGFFSSENGACPARMDRWVDLEIDEIRKQLASDDFAMQARVVLYERMQNGSGDIRCAGAGELTMTRDGIYFAGEKEQREFTYSAFRFLVLDDIKSLIIKIGRAHV